MERDVRRRAELAVTKASTLAEAREIYGAKDRKSLRFVVLRYPELLEAYDALPTQARSPDVRKKGNEASVRKNAERRNIFLEDVELLVSCGTSYTEVARRTGKSLSALSRALQRADRRDLLRRMGLTSHIVKKSYQTEKRTT